MTGQDRSSDQPSQNGPVDAQRGSSPSVSFTEDAMSQLGVHARSSSPAKRSAAEFEEQEEADHSTQKNTPTSTALLRKKSVSQHVSPMPSRFKPLNGDVGQSDAMMIDGEDAVSEQQSNGASISPSQNGSNRTSTPPTSTSAQSAEQEISDSVEQSSTKSLPSFDDQIQTITDMTNREPPVEGAKGFALSRRWTTRVQSRTTQGLMEGHDKSLREGEIGPVDNSDIAHNDNLYGDLKLASGEPFIPLREGVSMDADFDVIPQEAWDQIVAWYGVAEDSHIIVRYMHRTSDSDAAGENLQYELFPPICTIQKLPNDKAGQSLDQVKQHDASAPIVVASRSEKLQSFLRRMKTAAEVDMSVKVRVWRVLETGSTTLESSKMPTPVSSRNNSPVPPDRLPQTRPRLVVDMSSFSTMEEGSHCERLDINDETANDKYNGSSTVDLIGLPSTCTFILDEQIRDSAKEEFVSDGVSTGSNKVAVHITNKDGQQDTSNTLRAAANTGSGRRSATPSGIMTRGRTTRKGRTRGATGLTNLGNTCYMNSALQCIRSVEELSYYFLAGKDHDEINYDNPLGHSGAIAKVYESFVDSIYSLSSNGSFAPRNFKSTLGRRQPLFSGYGQQDSQEFLSFLVDGLHEDLNRIIKKPYIENPESDDNTVNDPDAVRQLGETFRRNHRARNDSVAMDLFNGFYKNTMVCPVCDKISVTFDPYSLHTLQLPIESTFQHKFFFSPLYGKPRYVDVDIDKNSTVRTLKEWIGKRVKVSADHLVIIEEYTSKLYQVLEDSQILSESNLQQNDNLHVVELDQVPTNWPPIGEKKPRSYSFWSTSSSDPVPPMSSPVADRMAVPIFHRVDGTLGLKFDLHPSFVIITREEAKDDEKILRKTLKKVQAMTSRNLFDEENMRQNGTSREGSDTEVMYEEDGLSNDEDPHARSVEGEDGLVDVSMGEVGDRTERSAANNPPKEPKSNVLDPNFFIIPELRRLFEIRVATSSSGIMPVGLSAVSEHTRYPSLQSRVDARGSRQSHRRRPVASQSRRGSGSSEDELSREEPTSETQETTPPASDEDSNLSKIPGQLNSASKGRNSQASPDSEYLIKLGEGFVLDWDPEGYQQLFSGDGERGSRTDKQVETLPDPDLAEKKARRASRKKNGLSLEECFEETAKSEVLSEDNAWYCSRCKELRRATKKLEIWTVPDILVVHLKRFSAQSRMRDKVDVLVDFPTEGLNLKGKVGLPEGKSLTYDLFAVDNHYGGLGGGHYTAYAQNFFDRQWYDYNDQIVTPTSPASAVSRAAYLLFYRRRQDKPLGGPALEQIVHDQRALMSAGEDQRPGDSSSNGSSDDSRGSRHGTAASRQGAHGTGSLNSYQDALGGIAQDVERQMGMDAGRGPREGSAEELPAYHGGGFDDEGFYEGNLSRSIEDDAYPQPIGPVGFSDPSWAFGDLDNDGSKAPPGSDNGENSSTLMNGGSDDGEGQGMRIGRDFEGESTPMFASFDSESGSQHVEHVSAFQETYQDDNVEDAVDEIKVGSDEERSPQR